MGEERDNSGFKAGNNKKGRQRSDQDILPPDIRRGITSQSCWIPNRIEAAMARSREKGSSFDPHSVFAGGAPTSDADAPVQQGTGARYG